MELIHQGKVRDVYADGGDLILVASDRVSVYDVVLPTPIPGKGALLTALSLWWFEQLADIVPNHVISAEDVPAEFSGRALRVKRLEILKVEAVVRGYLTGSGLAEYDKTGTVCGNELPEGLVDGSRLPEPIYTPTTKADIGDHDLPMTYEETVAKLGPDLAARIRDLTFAIYKTAAQRALAKGIIIADTKFEFGIDADGTLRLADEVLTSDSSRFWEAAAWKPGQTQPSFDKQYVRDWARSTGWKPTGADAAAEAPEIPQDVADATLARYIEAYELLTGRTWS